MLIRHPMGDDKLAICDSGERSRDLEFHQPKDVFKVMKLNEIM